MAIDFDHTTIEEAEWIKKQFPEPYAKKPRKSKYNARRTEYNGVIYDSKVEADHAAWLDWLIGSSDPVAWWLRQVTIPLGPDFKARVDFLVARVHSTQRMYVRIEAHEIKGAETREFKKVRQLWPKYGPFPLVVIKSGESWETINGKA